MITLGQILDLIDNSRESEEIVNIMNSGQIEVKAMVRSGFWKGLEDRAVNSIQAEDSELNIWLED